MPAEQANLYPDAFYSTPTRETQALMYLTSRGAIVYVSVFYTL